MSKVAEQPQEPRIKGPAVKTRKMTALRIPEAQLAELKDRAGAARLTFTEYMIRCGLGESIDPSSTEQRVDQLEERIARLEQLAYGQ